MNLNVKKLNADHPQFDQQLAELIAWDASDDAEIDLTVSDIIRQVRRDGDKALLALTERFDGFSVEHADNLRLSQDDLVAALQAIAPDQRNALELAAERIRNYHQHQLQKSWQYQDADGTILGQKVTAIEKVGVYVPGGKAAYPSSVLMNCIPAKVAGVKKLLMVSPTPKAEINTMVMAAAAIAGVDEFIRIGGAQAIAALAYGTDTVAKVDKIVGPGNIFVATAKRKVFGQVGIDMLAGPSEILVICDGETNPDWIAMDLFSQAEHDEMAQAILLSPDASFIDAVEASMSKLLPTLDRQSIVSSSMNGRGALIKVRDLNHAADIANRVASEHLELSVADPDALLDKIDNAGAVFMGRYTPEALGDYCAGPNHVLPTSTTSRFSSPLGVYDFQKRTSIIHCSPQGASELAKIADVLARSESLTAHARSATYRSK